MFRRLIYIFLILAAIAIAALALSHTRKALSQITDAAENQRKACQPKIFEGVNFTVCTFTAADDIRLFWGEGDTPFGDFDQLAHYVEGKGETLVFAMNGGMYHPDRKPVGYYMENGVRRQGLQTKAGPGNFSLLPNGVFFFHGKDIIGVEQTGTFERKGLIVDNATQSGPMLVIEGVIHPKFQRDSDSRKRRNGVGVSADRQSVYFVISEQPVNFHRFARLFKDELKTPNALYLDGVVSRLYDIETGRNDPGMPMGPIIGVVR